MTMVAPACVVSVLLLLQSSSSDKGTQICVAAALKTEVWPLGFDLLDLDARQLPSNSAGRVTFKM